MKPLIIANWKMNPTTLAEAKRLFNSVKKGIKNIKGVEVIICPPFVYLSNLLNPKPYLPRREAKLLLRGTLNPKLGAQDCFWAESGAFTGEISPKMLRDLGCQYVILGHSERRRYLGEADEMINKKLKAAIAAKLKPIFCIGETKKQRKTGKIEEILKKQLKNLSEDGPRTKLIVAYEPIWAIGAGKACGIKEAKEVNLFLRKIIKNIPILYGGSVNSKNAKDYIEKAGFQGLLVGGASLNAQEFIKIVKSVSKA